MVLECIVLILLLTTFSTVLSLCKSVWCFWEQPSLRQLNFGSHHSSEYAFDNQISRSLFVLTNSFPYSKDFFKSFKQFISLWLLWHDQHLILLCGSYFSLLLPPFCSLPPLSELWIIFEESCLYEDYLVFVQRLISLAWLQPRLMD